MPVGRPTRGTTNVNRLRRVDRWIAAHPALRAVPEPIVVDLGFGASGATAFELFERLHPKAPGVRVVGIEIDPDRVATASAQLAAKPELVRERVSFARGGFETPLPAALGRGARPQIIRAFNVLRQYDEAEVPAAWELMLGRLAPDGLLVEGTCSEIGRVSSCRRSRPSGCRRRSSTGTCRASASTTGSRPSTPPGSRRRRARPSAPASASSRRSSACATKDGPCSTARPGGASAR